MLLKKKYVHQENVPMSRFNFFQLLVFLFCFLDPQLDSSGSVSQLSVLFLDYPAKKTFNHFTLHNTKQHGGDRYSQQQEQNGESLFAY